MNIIDLVAHARSVARAFHVRLIEDTGLAREEAMSYPIDRLPPAQRGPWKDWAGVVACSPIEDETGYAIALHEIGHVVSPMGCLVHERMRARSEVAMVSLKLMEEEAAWGWAERHALDWTTAMAQVKEFGMNTYRAGLVEAKMAATPRPVDQATTQRASAIADRLARGRTA